MFPTQITLRNLPSSPDLGARIRGLCEKLALLSPRIQNCRVAVEQAAPSFIIEIQVRLPDRDVTCPRESDEDVNKAIRKAFSAVRRQLREGGLVHRRLGHIGSECSARS